MSTPRTIDESAKAIQKEIGFDLSYFHDDAEPHFDPVTIAATTGVVLLGSFLHGVLEGMKDEAEKAGKSLGSVLVGRLKSVFAGAPAKPIEDESRADAQAATAAARSIEVKRVVRCVTVTEERLVVILADERGLPRRDAQRIARTVRVEAMQQLGVSEE
jgi:hypothetical protein